MLYSTEHWIFSGGLRICYSARVGVVCLYSFHLRAAYSYFKPLDELGGGGGIASNEGDPIINSCGGVLKNITQGLLFCFFFPWKQCPTEISSAWKGNPSTFLSFVFCTLQLVLCFGSKPLPVGDASRRVRSSPDC